MLNEVHLSEFELAALARLAGEHGLEFATACHGAFRPAGPECIGVTADAGQLARYVRDVRERYPVIGQALGSRAWCDDGPGPGRRLFYFPGVIAS